MGNYRIQPSRVKGSLAVPPSKSHTIRAILFGALAEGKSAIRHPLDSPDTDAMIHAVAALGAKIARDKDSLVIEGFGGRPRVPDNVIESGNSGQVLRFIGALGGLMPHYTVITGDASIRHNRPVKPLLSAMAELGAFAESARGDGYAPIIVKGPFTKQKASLEGADSQPVSGLLIAAAFASHPIELTVINPGEKPWIDLTLDWLRKLGIPYSMRDYAWYRMEGGARIQGFSYDVPGDFSTAAFPIAAALLTGSELELANLDMGDVQGDKAIIRVLQEMGAVFDIDSKRRTLKVKKSHLKGIRIDINDFVDALPILAVVGCFAEGKTEIVNAAIARKKESDRIHAIAHELKKMGAKIEERPDGLVIEHSILRGAVLDTYHDHRLVLSLSVAALAAESPSVVCNVECAAKTYGSFFEDFRGIGARLEREPS